MLRGDRSSRPPSDVVIPRSGAPSPSTLRAAWGLLSGRPFGWTSVPEAPRGKVRRSASLSVGAEPSLGLGDDRLHRRADGLLPRAGYDVAPELAQSSKIGPQLSFPGES